VLQKDMLLKRTQEIFSFHSSIFVITFGAFMSGEMKDKNNNGLEMREDYCNSLFAAEAYCFHTYLTLFPIFDFTFKKLYKTLRKEQFSLV
jgi:hypothetical protein